MGLIENRNAWGCRYIARVQTELYQRRQQHQQGGTTSQASIPIPRLMPKATISTAGSRNRLCQ